MKLAPGSLLLIEKGEAHEIVNTGDLPLVRRPPTLAMASRCTAGHRDAW
jgi:hypothetical protein